MLSTVYNLPALNAQAEHELKILEPIIGSLTGRTSQWTGLVYVHEGRGAKGAKSVECGITLDAARMSLPVRWRTYIHEMLHAHSEGLEQSAFEDFLGYEEGVVEQLQRLLRPQILIVLRDEQGISFSEEDMAAMDAEEKDHWYNTYIESLEKFRFNIRNVAVPSEPLPFYCWLLGIPIGARHKQILVSGKSQMGFIPLFIRENANLKRNINREQMLRAYSND